MTAQGTVGVSELNEKLNFFDFVDWVSYIAQPSMMSHYGRP